MKKSPKKKKPASKSTLRYEVTELPSDNNGMEEYVKKNRKELNERIVANIEYALKNRLGGVEVFCFENSSFVVVINRKDFREALQGVFDYCLDNEQFELCEKTKRAINKMDKLSYVYSYTKVK
jgi:hypothetical protein